VTLLFLLAAGLTLQAQITVSTVSAQGAESPVNSLVEVGTTAAGERLDTRFRLRNTASASVTLRVLRAAGAAFSMIGNPPLPYVIAPGANVDFRIRFEPHAAGTYSATLTVNERTVVVRGLATAAAPVTPPPFPTLALSVPPTLASARQASLKATLSSPSPIAGTVSLWIEFSGQPDPAIVFLRSGSRTLTVDVKQGDIALPEIPFQTGTTAGIIRFRAAFSTENAQIAATIAPTPVIAESVRAIRSGSTLQVELTGYDNTRSASAVLFRFYYASGLLLPNMPVRADVKESFSRHFDSAALGGLFHLRAIFPVTGDASSIGSVEVETINLQGASASSRAGFPAQ
jgi:hypothetical protein